MNIHGTALIIGDRGVLIIGASGSGKSSLALALIDRFAAAGRFARLVGDDQLLVTGFDGRLVVRTPPAIAGLVEVFGLGPATIRFEPQAVIDFVVRLIPCEALPRMQAEGSESICGCALPALDVAERNTVAAMMAVYARLNFLSFGPD